MSINMGTIDDFVSPPWEHRLAEGRPVFSREQATTLCKRVLELASGKPGRVGVYHTARVINRITSGRILPGDDGEEVIIQLDGRPIYVSTNQLDDLTLQAAVARWEALKDHTAGHTPDPTLRTESVQDTPLPVQLWHDATIHAMKTVPETVLPGILAATSPLGLNSAVFVGLMARAEATLTQNGIFFYYDETDSELTVTVRGDGQGSGWAGQAARDWSSVKPNEVVARAVEFAKRSANPVAVEPGRRTAILGPDAVAQILAQMAEQFDAGTTDRGSTGFSDHSRRNKLRQRVFDPRINLYSDPNDPDGGYCPFFSGSYATPAMQWIERGVLKNMAYNVLYAMERGKPYVSAPYSVHMSAEGATMTVDEMIGQCEDGVYVNRFSNVGTVDRKSGMMTGVSQDGCFLVKNGKITKALKNFRFLDSPFFIFNNVIALSQSRRAAFGFTTVHRDVGYIAWPLPPVIAPAIMVRDFNFSAIVDAV